MENNANLFNAAVIGENPDTAFVVEGNHLHAVEQRIAEQKKDKSNPRLVIPLMKDALKALIQFAKGKIEPHFLEVDVNSLSGQPEEQIKQLVAKIHQIYSHLPHHDRQELSSLIHHKQTNTRRTR